MSPHGKQNVNKDMNTFIFIQIFTMFTNLKHLNFVSSLIWYQLFSFTISPPPVFSSNLVELHVSLDHFTDCLYLLDGHFKQLRRLHVNISTINSSSLVIDNKVGYFI